MYLADLGLCGSSRKMKTLSVGWLDMAHEFPKGPVPEGFLDRLIELIKKPVGMNMGGHACQFCPAHVFADRTKWPYQAPRGANGEIQVQGKEGISYSGPHDDSALCGSARLCTATGIYRSCHDDQITNA